MQITVKSTKVLRTGTNEHGDWKLVKVLTEDTEYTTFADGAENLAPGTAINITDMDEDVKGKKFKKYEVINGSQPPPESPQKSIERTPPSNEGNGAARGMSVKEIGDMMRAIFSKADLSRLSAKLCSLAHLRASTGSYL